MHHLEYFVRLCAKSVGYKWNKKSAMDYQLAKMVDNPHLVHFAQGVRQKHNVRLLESLGYVEILSTRHHTDEDEEGDPINPVFVFKIVPKHFIRYFRVNGLTYNIWNYYRKQDGVTVFVDAADKPVLYYERNPLVFGHWSLYVKG